jgi:hypothetical protein
MAKKRPKPSKPRTRKKATVAGTKKRRGRTTNSVHHAYELDPDFQDALDELSTDVETIQNKLDDNDLNKAPTEGILKRIAALIAETNNGTSKPTDHDNKIEKILYAIAGMDDQYYIDKKRPVTQAYPAPTGGAHEGRVLRLFTTINSICRDVFSLLEPGTILTVQPKPTGDNTKDIVAMAVDTETVVDNILNHVVNNHSLVATSK